MVSTHNTIQHNITLDTVYPTHQSVWNSMIQHQVVYFIFYYTHPHNHTILPYHQPCTITSILSFPLIQPYPTLYILNNRQADTRTIPHHVIPNHHHSPRSFTQRYTNFRTKPELLHPTAIIQRENHSVQYIWNHPIQHSIIDTYLPTIESIQVVYRESVSHEIYQ